MTVQDPRESKVDTLSEFGRRHTVPASSLWNGKEVENKQLIKSYSHYINPLHLQHHSDTDNRLHSTDSKKLQERHPNSARTVFKQTKVDEIKLPYAHKESSLNRDIQKYLLKQLKANTDHVVSINEYEASFIRLCYEAVDDVFAEASDQPVTELIHLVNDSMEEAKKRVFALGMILNPIRERFRLLYQIADDYIKNGQKKRTRWTDELLTELSLINEYLNPNRNFVEGENRVLFFLDYLEKKVKNSVIYGILSKAIQPEKAKASKLLKILHSFSEEQIKENIMGYYYKRIELIQRASTAVEWRETDSACCKLSKINRSGMASSLVRDFVNNSSVLSVNGVVIDVETLLNLPSEEEKVKGFFESLAKLITKNGQNVPQIVDAIQDKQPSAIDSILWSCCFHAWANPEVLLQERLMALTKNGYVVLKGPATDCSVTVEDDPETFDIDIRKEFCIYPTDKDTGIKDESQPIVYFLCSWNYKPQEGEVPRTWVGRMKIEKLHFVEGVLLEHREKVTDLLLQVLQNN